ncbi:MFS multidrug resistance [Raphidocelis subcapitata]|uniref:MFS multidrug resistance n=1 Tax=Raphidocelis subcapitata TaxID=307507 RepID=A0A2V0P0G2_9CHLO|nr:MFS multidrug resistance [Raphidocelis subcapitata]|eukprot:GBF93358.1 MFS multidrug resistance [Raphidocelis subcapitata]
MGLFKGGGKKAAGAAALDVEAAAAGPAAARSAAAADGPAAKDGGGEHPTSIYSIYSRRRKGLTLFVCACSTALVPICDTIYLPAVDAVQQSLKTTAGMVATSISVYMYTLALGALFFGPVADRFGRRVTLLGSTAAFTALSVACMLAPTIEVLLAFRAVQGFVVAACSTTSNAILADTYAPAERGRAMGVAAIPFLVGPVIGPLLGGGLSQSLGWRATFAALVVFGGVMVAAQLLVIQETHHFFALRRLRATRGDAAADAIQEEAHPPHFDPPYKPLVHLWDRHIAPYAAVTVMLFAVMFASMIVLPLVLAAPPYNMGEGLLGVANGVPFGLGGLLAAPLGGAMADACARRWRGAPEGRMVYASAVAVAVQPLAVLLFGWGMHFKLPAAVPLLGGFFINFAMTSHMPATMSLISIHKQRYAAAAGGGLHALQFLVAGAFVQATPVGVASLGVGPYMSLCAGLALAATLASIAAVAAALRAARRAAGAPGAALAAAEAGDGGAAGAGAGAGAGPAAAAAAAASPPHSPRPGAPLGGPALSGRRSSLDAALEGIAGTQAA